MSLYSSTGGSLFGTFLSGERDRGGVFEDDARRPRKWKRLMITSLCRLLRAR